MFILFRALRNILQIDNNAKGIHRHIAIVTFDSFLLLTAISGLTMQRENIVAFSRQSLQCLHALLILLFYSRAVDEIAVINGSNWKRIIVMLVTVRASELSVCPEHVQDCYHRCLLGGPYSYFYWCDTSRHTFCVHNFYSRCTIIFLPCFRKKVFKKLLCFQISDTRI